MDGSKILGIWKSEMNWAPNAAQSEIGIDSHPATGRGDGIDSKVVRL
jgi:hypothetical protein